MLTHEGVWAAIDRLASQKGLKPSSLARRAGLDPTTFNRSKRFSGDGRPRWPSTESIAKILRATGTTITEFFADPDDGPSGSREPGAAHTSAETAADPDMTNSVTFAPPLANVNATVAFLPPSPQAIDGQAVDGEALATTFTEGTIVLVAMGAPTETRDDVVVKSNTDVMVRTLSGDAPVSFAPVALAPDHEDAAPEGEQVVFVARILWASQ